MNMLKVRQLEQRGFIEYVLNEWILYWVSKKLTVANVWKSRVWRCKKCLNILKVRKPEQRGFIEYVPNDAPEDEIVKKQLGSNSIVKSPYNHLAAGVQHHRLDDGIL